MTPNNQVNEICKLITGQAGHDALFTVKNYVFHVSSTMKELEKTIDLLQARIKELENEQGKSVSIDSESNGSGTTEGNRD